MCALCLLPGLIGRGAAHKLVPALLAAAMASSSASIVYLEEE
jgi:hypothetical protein